MLNSCYNSMVSEIFNVAAAAFIAISQHRIWYTVVFKKYWIHKLFNDELTTLAQK